MANNICGGGCSTPKSGFQPCVCIGDLSKTTQRYVRINTSATGIAGTSDMTTKFQNMTRLAVEHCIKFNPCCTSNVATDSAANLVQFLNADFAPADVAAQITTLQTALNAAIALRPFLLILGTPAQIVSNEAFIASLQANIAALQQSSSNLNTLAQRFLTGNYTCGGQVCC